MSDKPDKTKHEIMKEAFELWQKLAMTRLGIAAVGVPEDKKETLNMLLEAAFEAAFSFGVQKGMHEVMSDLVSHVKSNGKDGGVIVADGFPMNTVGNA